MGEIQSCTLLVTEECNYSCSYCYQKKGQQYLDISAAQNTINCLLPHLAQDCFINFSGGEPLLAFDLIQKTVDFIKNKNLNKNIQFAITTNGSRINEKILTFLRHNRFSLMLSFDGTAQNFSRCKNSYAHISSLIKKLLYYPEIELEIHSVFTPQTIHQLYKSMKHIFALGIQNASLAFSYIHPWNAAELQLLKIELSRVMALLLSIYKQNSSIPLKGCRADEIFGKFQCMAGRDRIALSADGKLWGCYLMGDYFRGKDKTEDFQKYCLGELESFKWHRDSVESGIPLNYLRLAGQYFTAFNPSCRTCPEAEECVICPMNVAFSSSLGKEVPAWMCEIKKTWNQARKLLWKQIEAL